MPLLPPRSPVKTKTGFTISLHGVGVVKFYFSQEAAEEAEKKYMHLVEAKSVETILPIHKAQLLSYMKLLNVPLGLFINFNVSKLTDGVSRLILLGADS